MCNVLILIVFVFNIFIHSQEFSSVHFHHEEDINNLNDVQNAADIEAKKIIDSIPEERLNECVLSIRKIYQDISEEVAQDKKQLDGKYA